MYIIREFFDELALRRQPAVEVVKREVKEKAEKTTLYDYDETRWRQWRTFSRQYRHTYHSTEIVIEKSVDKYLFIEH